MGGDVACSCRPRVGPSVPVRGRGHRSHGLMAGVVAHHCGCLLLRYGDREGRRVRMNPACCQVGPRLVALSRPQQAKGKLVLLDIGTHEQHTVPPMPVKHARGAVGKDHPLEIIDKHLVVQQEASAASATGPVAPSLLRWVVRHGYLGRPWSGRALHVCVCMCECAGGVRHGSERGVGGHNHARGTTPPTSLSPRT